MATYIDHSRDLPLEEEIATTLESQFKVQAPSRQNPGWRWKGPRKISTPCSNCTSTWAMFCQYADAGALDYYDEFYHICLSCGHIDHNSLFGGYYSYEGHAFCTFCRYKWE